MKKHIHIFKIVVGFLSKEEAEYYHNLYAEIDIEAYEALGFIFPDLPSLAGECFYLKAEWR